MEMLVSMMETLGWKKGKKKNNRHLLSAKITTRKMQLIKIGQTIFRFSHPTS